MGSIHFARHDSNIFTIMRWTWWMVSTGLVAYVWSVSGIFAIWRCRDQRRYLESRCMPWMKWWLKNMPFDLENKDWSEECYSFITDPWSLPSHSFVHKKKMIRLWLYPIDSRIYYPFADCWMNNVLIFNFYFRHSPSRAKSVGVYITQWNKNQLTGTGDIVCFFAGDKHYYWF